MEVNQFLQFDGVNESNLESIIRRMAIIRIQARFFEQQYIDNHFSGPEKYGIFARDPSAQDFMTSKPAVAAGLRLSKLHLAPRSFQSVGLLKADRRLRCERCEFAMGFDSTGAAAHPILLHPT